MKIVKSIFCIIIFSGIIMAQTVRPVRDNIGFCWKANEMDSLISYLDVNNKVAAASGDDLILGISPHDDFLYAGAIYLPLYKVINAKEVVIFGVTHRTVRDAINDPQNVLIFDEYKNWQGPYKNVEISSLRETIKNNLDNSFYIVSNKAHDIEHSIEALVPFLQHYNKDVKITPIMVTGMSLERMDSSAEALSNVLTKFIKEKNLTPGKDIFFLISSDANHYGEDFNNKPYGMDLKAHEEATARDKEIADAAFNGELSKEKIKALTQNLWKDNNGKSHPLWCGQYSIPYGLLTTIKTIKKLNNGKLKGKVLTYSDTWTQKVIDIKNTHLGLTAPFSLKHWVGFLSAGFYLDK